MDFVPIKFFEILPDVSVLSRVVYRSVLVPGWEELIVPVTVSDLPLPALVDTGADANFIDTEIVNESEILSSLVVPCKPINMTLPDGSAGPVITNICTADLAFDGNTYTNEEFLVAPTTTTDVVLGQKFLKKNQCCIECSTGTITCQPQEDAACPEKLGELTPVSK